MCRAGGRGGGIGPQSRSVIMQVRTPVVLAIGLSLICAFLARIGMHQHPAHWFLLAVLLIYMPCCLPCALLLCVFFAVHF
jgi:hypothetical protein